MASYKQLKNLQKCKNKFRHKWIDEGGKKSPTYCYKCEKCGAGKIKSSTYAASYYKDGVLFGYRAPECVA